jgi:pre-mRNA-splicing factor SYF1
LADVWIDFAEMELRADNVEKALEIMALATKSPRVSNVDYFNDVLPTQSKLTLDSHSTSTGTQIE